MAQPKAVLYTRVSRDQQVENTSLDEQERLGHEYCNRRKFELACIFREEGESAKTQDRPQLKQAIAYCTSKKNQITYFIVHKFDRFSRSVEDHHMVKAVLSKYGVKLVSITEPTEDSPSGRLLENVLAAVAQFDNEIRAERLVGGSKAKLMQGIYIYTPPPGYIRAPKDKSGARTPIPDPDTYEKILAAWKMKLSGRFLNKEITQYLQKHGVKNTYGNYMSENNISRLFQNKFYAGRINIESLGIVDIKGKHKAMITIDEWYKAQRITEQQSNSKQVTHLDHNPDFPLNKLLKCKNCGGTMTGGFPKPKFGYYRCYNKQCVNKQNIRKEKPEEAFLEYLGEITPSDELVALYKQVVMNTYGRRLAEKEAVQKSLRKQLRELEDRQEKLDDLVEEGIYSHDKYKAKMAKLEPLLAEKRIQLSETNIDKYDMETCVNYSMDFLQRLPTFWTDLLPRDKFKLHSVLFPEGVKYENGKIATDRLPSIYRHIQEVAEDPISLHGACEI